jgi:hypothetical protein
MGAIGLLANLLRCESLLKVITHKLMIVRRDRFSTEQDGFQVL